MGQRALRDSSPSRAHPAAYLDGTPPVEPWPPHERNDRAANPPSTLTASRSHHRPRRDPMRNAPGQCLQQDLLKRCRVPAHLTILSSAPSQPYARPHRPEEESGMRAGWRAEATASSRHRCTTCRSSAQPCGSDCLFVWFYRDCRSNQYRDMSFEILWILYELVAQTQLLMELVIDWSGCAHCDDKKRRALLLQRGRPSCTWESQA